MEIKPVISQANGVISVQMQALFVGDPTDATDKALIAAFGDPLISLVGTGTFTVPLSISPPVSPFIFVFPITEYFVGITTQMSSKRTRFMLALPTQGGITPPYTGSSLYNPNQHALRQGELDCITTNPSFAAQSWVTAMINEITAAMTALRLQVLVPPLPPTTV